MWKQILKTGEIIANKVLPDLAEQSIPESIPDNTLLLPITPFSQGKLYYCGAVTAYTVIHYFRPKIRWTTVRNLVDPEGSADPDAGTGSDHTQVFKALRKYDIRTQAIKRPSFQKVEDAIKKGYPIVVSTNDHWMLVIGVVHSQRKVIVAGDRPFRSEIVCWDWSKVKGMVDPKVGMRVCRL